MPSRPTRSPALACVAARASIAASTRRFPRCARQIAMPVASPTARPLRRRPPGRRRVRRGLRASTSPQQTGRQSRGNSISPPLLEESRRASRAAGARARRGRRRQQTAARQRRRAPRGQPGRDRADAASSRYPPRPGRRGSTPGRCRRTRVVLEHAAPVTASSADRCKPVTGPAAADRRDDRSPRPRHRGRRCSAKKPPTPPPRAADRWPSPSAGGTRRSAAASRRGRAGTCCCRAGAPTVYSRHAHGVAVHSHVAGVEHARAGRKAARRCAVAVGRASSSSTAAVRAACHL